MEDAPPKLQFTDAQDGTTRWWTADEVRELVAHPGETVDGKTICRVCGFIAIGAGLGPHSQSHLRAIGDVPERKKAEPKKGARGPYNKKPKADSIDDACYALIAHTVGDRIPISMIGDVTAWVESTKKLIGALK